MNANRTYYPGDVLRRTKGLITKHVGLAISSELAFHNDPVKGECIVPISEFAAGKPVEVERPAFNFHETAARLKTRLAAPRPYHVLENNCEHSVSSVLFGRAESPQLQAFGAALIAGILLVALSKS